MAAPVSHEAETVTRGLASASQILSGFSWLEGFFRLRNARLYQAVIPWVFRCALNWRCKDKDANQSYLHYFTGLRGRSFSGKELRKMFFKEEIELLNDITPENFDSTFLYKLITLTWDEFDADTASAISATGAPAIDALGAAALPATGVPATTMPSAHVISTPTVDTSFSSESTTSAHGSAVTFAPGELATHASGVPATPAHGSPGICAHDSPAKSAHGSPATPTHGSPSWKRLKKLLMQCKYKRNVAAHEVATTVLSESYFDEVKLLLEKLLDGAADYYEVPLDEKKRITSELQMILNKTEHGLPNDENLWNIREKFLTEGKKEMKTKWRKFSRTKLLFDSNLEFDVKSIYIPVLLKQWEKAISDMTDSVDIRNFKAESIFGEWPGKGEGNIKLLNGDAGSGKTFLTRIIFLSWLGLINVKFNHLEEFELLLYMECRNDRHESLKELIKVNYPRTCSGLDMDKVLDSFTLVGSRNLYIVDGADERNVRSNRLLEDILDQFSPDSRNMCLIASRPHEVESVKHLLNNKGLNYQSCTITELSEDQQVKSLEQLQNAVDQSASLQSLPSCQRQVPANIVECFERIQIKSVFCHPLNLVYFFELYQNMPDEVVTWTGEADVMHALHKLYIKVTVQKLEDTNCSLPNLDIIVRKAFAHLGSYSFKLFANKKYRLTEEDYNQLRATCYEKVSHDVDYKRVFSNVLWCEKDAHGRETGIYNFPHRSTQEYLQAMAIIESWEESCRRAVEEGCPLEKIDSISKSLFKMITMNKSISGTGTTSTATSVSPCDFGQYGRTFQFIILELLRTDHSKHEVNIKSLSTLLFFSGVYNFQYWAGLVSGSRLHPVVVHEAAVSVDLGQWDVGPGEVRAADVILAYMKRCKGRVPERVIVDIPQDMEAPVTVSSFLRTAGGAAGGKMTLVLWFRHSFYNFEPSDALLGELKNSSLLRYFLGCLLMPGHVLAPLTTPHCTLHLALTDTDHDLHRIRDSDIHHLNVWLRCLSPPTQPAPHRRPLPEARINGIQLLDVPAGELEWPYLCLTALVPEDKGYDVVALGNCGLSDCHLDELRRRTVQTVAVSTEGSVRRSTDVEGAVLGWSTSSWGIVRDWSDGTRDIRL